MNACLPALLLLLAGCSARPPFRPGNFSVHRTEIAELFDIALAFPDGKPEYKASYLLLAAGEECRRLGFAHFEAGLLEEGKARAICHAKPRKKGIGARFAGGALAIEPRISDTPPGTHSPFRAFDRLLKIDGDGIESVGQYHEKIFRLSREGRDTASVLILRSEIPLRIEARLAELPEALPSESTLLELREKVAR